MILLITMLCVMMKEVKPLYQFNEGCVMEIKPIVTKRIYQSIVEQFVGLIRDGSFKISQKLPSERILAEMLHVSRPSVREALRAMEIIGLIEIRPGDGTVITNLNIGPFINTIAPLFLKREGFEVELLEFRSMLEVKAVELASKHITPEKADQLHEQIKKMKQALDADDPDLGARADIEFHRLIFVLTDNIVLTKASECVVSILEISVRYARTLLLEDAANAEKLYREHSGIYKAIRDGSAERAKKHMEEHLNSVIEFYKAR